MAMDKLTGKQLLILLLYSAGGEQQVCEPVEGRTRLTKMVFLFEREVLPDFRRDREVSLESLDFEAWKYGPMSRQVFADLDFLESVGFVATASANDASGVGEETEEYLAYEDAAELTGGENVDQYTMASFELSDLGKRFVEETKLYDELTKGQKTLLREFKANLNSAPLRAILQYVYRQYPEMATKSDIRADIVGE